MKARIPTVIEKEVSHIRVHLPVRYDEEDIPNDFPLRNGSMWSATIEVDTGRILNWPIGTSGDMHMKVVDEGSYCLYDPKGNEVGSIENDYVPNGVVPGEYGDYVDFHIDEQGVITNWPKHPDLSAFFPTI